MGTTPLQSVPQFDSLELIKSNSTKFTFAGFSGHAGAVSNGQESTLIGTITHNLGFVPILILLDGLNVNGATLSSGSVFSNGFQSNAWNSIIYEILADNNSFNIYLQNNYAAAAGGTTGNVGGFTNVPYTWYLLRQRAKASV